MEAELRTDRQTDRQTDISLTYGLGILAQLLYTDVGLMKCGEREKGVTHSITAVKAEKKKLKERKKQLKKEV